jgi:Bacterial regulatory proteins, luxR family
MLIGPDAGQRGEAGGRRVTGVIDVAAVGDHPIVLDGIADWIAEAGRDIRVAATVREAIEAVVGGEDGISPRLAYIFATDDAPDRPVLSPQETRALRLYATGMPMKAVARRMNISEETTKQYVGRVREKYARAGRAAPTKLDLYYRSSRGRAPPSSPLTADSPPGVDRGPWETPVLGALFSPEAYAGPPFMVMTPFPGSGELMQSQVSFPMQSQTNTQDAGCCSRGISYMRRIR